MVKSSASIYTEEKLFSDSAFQVNTMIDPVSAVFLTVKLTIICVKVVRQMKQTIEMMKKV